MQTLSQRKIEKEEGSYNEFAIKIAYWILIFTKYSNVAINCFFGWALWSYLPNKLVATLIIFFATTIPLMAWFVSYNALALIGMRLHEKVHIETPYVIIRTLGAWFVILLMKIVHGLEIHGEENLPKSSGALVVYYHPLLPLDVLYLSCKRYIQEGKVMGGIAHREIVKNLPGLTESFGFHASRDRLVRDLKEGQVRTVAPGGGIEGAFSENYELVWSGRIGFAEVAKECGVPIIPMLTVNCQEAMPVCNYGFTGLLKEVFRRTRETLFLPLIAMPVKMRTYIGKPIYCGENESPAEFAERAKAAVHELRDKHQRIPGSVLWAFLERFGYPPFTDEVHHKKLQ